MRFGIDDLRIALLISLSILVLVMLYRRFRLRTMLRDRPAPAHVELIGLEVAYHPARVRAWVKVPIDQSIETRLLDEHHERLHHWPGAMVNAGEHWIERPLVDRPDGFYHFELSTGTQRTVRRFRLQQA
jgi:hypothetical protein